MRNWERVYDNFNYLLFISHTQYVITKRCLKPLLESFEAYYCSLRGFAQLDRTSNTKSVLFEIHILVMKKVKSIDNKNELLG